MRTRARKGSRDLSEIAVAIVEAATSEEQPAQPEEQECGKNPHAQALAKLGARKGGLARAAKLTPEERRQSAKKAAISRWKKATRTTGR